jgi:hypothetical protein
MAALLALAACEQSSAPTAAPEGNPGAGTGGPVAGMRGPEHCVVWLNAS